MGSTGPTTGGLSTIVFLEAAAIEIGVRARIGGHGGMIFERSANTRFIAIVKTFTTPIGRIEGSLEGQSETETDEYDK